MNIIERQNHELVSSDTLIKILSNLHEEEFVQMVLPLVHLLKVEQIEFLLLNITSEEVAELISRIKDADILNRIAIETMDGIVAAECAKHKLLKIESLNSLLDRFFDIYHLVTYTEHFVADNNFFLRVLKFLENYRVEYKFSMRGEYVVMEQIARHKNAEGSSLDIIADFIEKSLVKMLELKRLIQAMPKFKNCGWGTTSLDNRTRSEFDEGREYNKIYSMVRDYFPAFLEVMSNANLSQSRQLYFVEKYGNLSSTELDATTSDYSMMLMSTYFGDKIHNADTVMYRVSINKNCPEELKTGKSYEIKGDETIWTQGSKFIARWSLVHDPDQIRSAWSAWKEKQKTKDSWFGSDTLDNLVKAFKNNYNIPSDVMTELIEYIIENKKFYTEILEHIVRHPNYTSECIATIAKRIAELDLANLSYMNKSVIIPICESSSMGEAGARILFDTLCDKNQCIEALIVLASNPNAVGLDAEFSKHVLRGVRKAYAARSESIVWLEYLMKDSDRDVVVAARRQYRRLTGEQLLLSSFQANQITVRES